MSEDVMYISPPMVAAAALPRRQRSRGLPEITRGGNRLVLPEGLSYEEGISVLHTALRRDQNESQPVSVHEVVRCFPWEGAIALKKALAEMFGAANTVDTKRATLFGVNVTPPREISIETGVGEKTMVPWGRFAFGNYDPDVFFLETTTAFEDGRMFFSLDGVVPKRELEAVRELAARVAALVKVESIYRGKALRIAFTDEDGDDIELPTPRFVDLTGVDLGDMVYTDELTQLIEVNVFTPLRYKDALRKAGIPLKRGIMLAGPYGTGKSLMARAVAKIGTEHGWTYIYIKNASELPDALAFAQNYTPAVIFAEDADRHVTGERTDEMDEILNTLDGIDTKTNEIMVVMTTNHLDQINPALMRPGRIDVLLNVVPPDAEAAARLVRVYARALLDPSVDLTAIGEQLAGFTPAVIREVVERAKLSAISRHGRVEDKLGADDLALATLSMVKQQAAFVPAPPKAPDLLAQLSERVAGKVYTNIKENGLGSTIMETENLARQILANQ